MLHNGQPVSQVQLCDYIIWDDWEHRVQQFIAWA